MMQEEASNGSHQENEVFKVHVYTLTVYVLFYMYLGIIQFVICESYSYINCQVLSATYTKSDSTKHKFDIFF